MDRAVYSGNYSAYTVTHNTNGSVTVAGPDGTDTLTSIEKLQFADQTVILKPPVSDFNGDGRPDYSYNGWVLYADTVPPQRLPASGGPLVIHGMGFRLADTVLVGGQEAIVTSISPNEMTAIAPAAAARGQDPDDIARCQLEAGDEGVALLRAVRPVDLDAEGAQLGQ